MKITFLGTGTSQGVPIIACQCEICQSENPLDKRLRASVLIETDAKNILIDAGPDFREQMLRHKVLRIDAILLTHEHRDHIAGLDDIRPFNYNQKAAINIFCEDRVLNSLHNVYYYVFKHEKYPGVPDMKLVPIENAPFQIGKTQVTPIRVMHLKLPIYGFRIGDFTYITDANYIDDSELEKAKGTKVLVINALRHKKHNSHFNLEDALAVIEKIKPKHAYLTHISHQMGFHTQVCNKLPKGVSLAYDGLEIEL